MLAIYFRALSVTWSSMFPQARRLLNVTNLYYPGPGKVQVCLSSVFYKNIYFSGFLKNLLSDHEVTDEPISIILADSDFDTAMAMMNLVYVGK